MTNDHCLFLTCNKRGPHVHEACETCGAVRHGNVFCLACLRWHQSIEPSALVGRLIANLEAKR